MFPVFQMLLKVGLGIELPQDVESLDRRELKQSLPCQ
jgi:hypothetical protein